IFFGLGQLFGIVGLLGARQRFESFLLFLLTILTCAEVLGLFLALLCLLPSLGGIFFFLGEAVRFLRRLLFLLRQPVGLIGVGFAVVDLVGESLQRFGGLFSAFGCVLGGGRALGLSTELHGVFLCRRSLGGLQALQVLGNLGLLLLEFALLASV